MNSEPPISFRRRPAKLDFGRLEKFASEVQRRVLKGAEFHCLITGDRESQELNRKYRKKDYPTDVLSFPLDHSAGGELAISLGRARAQARSFGHSVEEELCVLMLHGGLHLAGMDHETDRGEMARAEGRWRKQLGLGQGLIARSVA